MRRLRSRFRRGLGKPFAHRTDPRTSPGSIDVTFVRRRRGGGGGPFVARELLSSDSAVRTELSPDA
jgi:hypothetical protein